MTLICPLFLFFLREICPLLVISKFSYFVYQICSYGRKQWKVWHFNFHLISWVCFIDSLFVCFGRNKDNCFIFAWSHENRSRPFVHTVASQSLSLKNFFSVQFGHKRFVLVILVFCPLKVWDFVVLSCRLSHTSWSWFARKYFYFCFIFCC